MNHEPHLPSGSVNRRFDNLMPGGGLYRPVTVAGLLLLMFYMYCDSYRYIRDCSDLRLPFPHQWRSSLSFGTTAISPSTNLSHVVFVIVGSLKTWKDRKPYLESWWRPNISQGYLFLDGRPRDEFLCPFTCPVIKIHDNKDIRKPEFYRLMKFPVSVRVVHSILEAFKLGDRDVRWYVVVDDDSVLFVDNIVEVLSSYDHTKYFYIGASSESIISNAQMSFEMGFGGAGLALSYPLVAALAKRLEGCVKRHPDLWSDHLIYTCILELGVVISRHRGFHQIDLHDDISGLLSSHPQTPLLTLHHINVVDPIFPSMNRSESISHLMMAAGVDQSRLLQQSVCYDKEKNWSISVSWGYSAHIYEAMLSRYILQMPIETFNPWIKNAKWPKFMFNTRTVKNDPCKAPHWFFFKSIESRNEDEIVTTYTRSHRRGLKPCLLGGNHSADHIDMIQVFSPANTRLEAGTAECCDFLPVSELNSTTTVRIRQCMEAEEIA